jgi:hypothetical protein
MKGQLLLVSPGASGTPLEGPSVSRKSMAFKLGHLPGMNYGTAREPGREADWATMASGRVK